MPPATSSKALTITNPLVLYRALLATKEIKPDPAQHRLAIHLQKLYHRLKDYEPAIDFHHRIKQINRLANNPPNASNHAEPHGQKDAPPRRKGILGSLRDQREKSEATALTRKLTEPESAIELQSPRGLLLYGEVGTGKSLLVDLLADCLPNRKKRRWHFNNFMLETFTRIEQLRRTRSGRPDEHSLLSLARDLIATSPILFLDEFQIPDRAASKILSNLLTSFFHLGGVLIATSNRMPEELANAAGMEFTPPPKGGLGDRWKLWGAGKQEGGSGGMFAGKGDLAAFLEVLKARCEVWDMEGGKDWRRQEDGDGDVSNEDAAVDLDTDQEHLHGLEPMAAGNLGLGYEQSMHTRLQESGTVSAKKSTTRTSPPKYYFVRDESDDSYDFDEQFQAIERSATLPPSTFPFTPIPWSSTTLTVYARPLPVPLHHGGVTKWTFAALCGTALGPADYITLASTYHTFIITSIPVLTSIQKNEARRFITLLDALYESRCRLLLSASAGPDDLFFPDENTSVLAAENDREREDALHAETFAEIYQDANEPFRPNISSYTEASQVSPPSPPHTTYTPSASPPSYPSTHFRTTRSILADEDSDFGPVLGRHLPFSSHPSHSSSSHPPPSSTPPSTPSSTNSTSTPTTTLRSQPEFNQSTAYTGSDERFAYKRAASRLWEMCSSRWWSRASSTSSESFSAHSASAPAWWRPLPISSRSWESQSAPPVSGLFRPHVAAIATAGGVSADVDRSLAERAEADGNEVVGERDSKVGVNGATSPFRTSTEPPPKFSEVHAWGVMRWGRKAGVWGRGVEGVGTRKKGE